MVFRRPSGGLYSIISTIKMATYPVNARIKTLILTVHFTAYSEERLIRVVFFFFFSRQHKYNNIVIG